MAIIMKICEKKIWQEHRTICHYTTLESFIAIMKSKHLWASRYDLMEDPEEIKFSKEYLLRKKGLIRLKFRVADKVGIMSTL